MTDVAVRRGDPADGDGRALLAGAGTRPRAGVGELLVEVRVVLLGPEDLDGPTGVVVGREAVGVIVEVGPEVQGWHPGDRVALGAELPCATCGACLAGRATVCPQLRVPGSDLDGWLTSRAVVAAHAAHHVPPELDDAEAALVPGVVATAYHALKRSGIGPDVTVAVFGEDALAAHLTQLAALAGATVVTLDPRADGREHALDLGAEEVLDPTAPSLDEDLRELLGDRPDRVLLTPTAACTVTEAVRLLRPGGRCTVLDPRRGGTTPDALVPLSALVRDELDLVGASGATPQDVRELFDLAAEARLVLTTTIGDHRQLDELPAVVAALADPGVLRVAVHLGG